MKRLMMTLLLGAAACGDDVATPPDCQLWDLQDETGPLPSRALLVLGSALDYSASALDLVDPLEPACMAKNRVVATGDAVLRKAGERAVVLNRGASSYLQVVGGGAFPGRQVSLPGCNPHDLVTLDDGRALVSCYDDDAALLVDLDSGAVEPGPSFSSFADGDGLPELDHLARVGEHIYLSMQRLDRDNFYAPTGPGLVAVLDATSLELVDVDEVTGGVQALSLPCENPFSDLEIVGDALHVGCSGDFSSLGVARIVRLDPASGEGTVLFDGDELGGRPSALRLGPDGTPFAVIDADLPDEMRLVRLGAGSPEVLASSPGYTLGGFTVGADGTVYFANRSTDETAGLWRVLAGGELDGPYATSLPPWELELF